MDILTAVKHNHVEVVSALLRDGCSPAPEGCDFSPLHVALHNRVLFQQRVAVGDLRLAAPQQLVFNISPDEAGVFTITPTILVGVYNTREERDKAEVIAHLLLAYGARLEEAPAGSRDPCPAAHDAGLWTDSAFGARIMLSALYSAIKRSAPLPRLHIRAAVAEQLKCADPTESWRVLLAASTRHMENLHRTIQQNLFTGSTPVAAFVATNLPSTEWDYWTPSFKAWERQVAKPLINRVCRP